MGADARLGEITDQGIPMTDLPRDDVVRLAREAGFAISEDARKYQPNCIVHTHHMIDEELQRFATLVRAATLAELEKQGPVAKVVLTETLGLPCLQWLDLTRQFDFKGGELLYATPAQCQDPMGWLVSNSEGDDDFVNNPTALAGRHYKGSQPVPLYLAALVCQQDEALLRQALEALESVAEGAEEPHVTRAAIAALKERLNVLA
jgi:hypothetical protein